MNHLFRSVSSFCIGLLLFTSCQETHNPNSKAIKEELRQREVIHLTDAMISERAFEMGDSLIGKAETEFIKALQKSTGPDCNGAFLEMKNLIAKEYDANIFRMRFDTSELKAVGSAKEREILDAYLYNRENKIPITPNYQKDGDKEFFFTKALTINDKTCAKCHTSASLTGIRANPGDTLGIWSVRFKKKKVVMSFVE